jgi:hypothetical protein
MFEVKITATSAEDLAQQLVTLTGLIGGTPVVAAAAAPAAPAAEAAPAKVKAVAAKPAKPAEAPKAEEPKAEEAPKTLDFNTEVAPKVVAVVEAHGKPVVASVLETFSVNRASEIEPSLWPEFLVALDDAVAALA